MKPIGTITKYYPFIEQAVRDIIDSIVTEAEDYRDFVVKLGERASQENVPFMLAYLAVKHALNTQKFEIVDSLGEKFGDVSFIRPLILMSRGLRGDRDALDGTLRAADEAIVACFEDWLIMEMHNIKLYTIAELADFQPDVPKAAEEARQHLRNRGTLESLAFWIYWAQGNAHFTSGEHDDAVEAFQAALLIARDHEDPNEAAYALKQLGEVVRFTDLAKALELFLDAAEEFKALGNFWGSASVLNSIGLLFASIGQYEEAVECHTESLRLQESNRLMPTLPLLNLAWLYCDIGDSGNALEFARMALDASRLTHGDSSVIYSHANLAMAFALALNNRVDEASRFLDTGLEAVVKVGSELDLMRYFLVRGLIEREKGDLAGSAQTYLRALEISERFGSPRYTVTCLLRLTEIEVALYIQESDTDHVEKATLSLSRIEQIAQEQSYPKVFVRVALLKADLLKAKGSRDTARKVMEEALEICRRAGMESMGKLVEERLAQLGIDQSKPELVEAILDLVKGVVIPSKKTQEIPYEIFGAIVIYREGGFELYSKYLDDRFTSDPSLVAGLISAVTIFAQELREDTEGELQAILHHDIAVLLEHGEFVSCALMTDRDTYRARVILRRFLEIFEEEFSYELRAFDGTMAPFRRADQLLEKILEQIDD